VKEDSGKQVAHARLEALGYALHAHCVDSFGRRWRYRTFPLTSGPINCFNSMAQVERYCEQVEQVRSWQL
jgi:hypothetical protein